MCEAVGTFAEPSLLLTGHAQEMPGACLLWLLLKDALVELDCAVKLTGLMQPPRLLHKGPQR